MKPVDQFLESVREGFSKNRTGDWTHIALLLLALVAVAIALSVWARRWRRRTGERQRIEAAVASAGLRPADRDFLTRIATTDGTTLLDVMLVLAAFERATARALRAETPVPRPAEGSVFERVGRLRKTLGFSPMPAHHWLLSTRELVAGDRIAVGGAAATIADVNEASLAVDLPPRTAHSQAPAAVVNLTIVRSDDSRYLARVRVLAHEPIPGAATEGSGAPPPRRVYFGHDEQPERQQNREHVRVRVQGPVAVRIVGPTKHHPGHENAEHAPDDAAERDGLAGPLQAGTLADVSAGGLSLDLPIAADGPIPRGARVHCSFTLDASAAFEMLAAVVSDAGTGPGAGKQHLRASFTGLGEAERDRLAAAVTRLQRRPPSDGGTGTA